MIPPLLIVTASVVVWDVYARRRDRLVREANGVRVEQLDPRMVVEGQAVELDVERVPVQRRYL